MPEETFAERTEAPTPRRRREARERGHVARSAELNAAVVLLAGMLGLYFFGAKLVALAASVSHCVLEAVVIRDADPLTAQRIGREVILLAARALWPFMLTVVAAAVAVNVIQIGFLLSPTPLTPDLGRLSPLNGLKRIFSRRGLVSLGVGVGKVVVVAAVAYGVIRGEAGRFASLADMGFNDIFTYCASVLMRLGVRLALALVGLALLDYAYQRWQYERDLMMSRQELRDELKRVEGDPQVRERRRRLERRLLVQRMMAQVPRAQVVITNPTRLALAVRYEPETMKAPKLVAKGRDLMAQRVCQAAAAHGVPIVERKGLAQSLFRALQAGDEIPQRFYTPVAEVLAYVHELKTRRLAGKTAKSLSE